MTSEAQIAKEATARVSARSTSLDFGEKYGTGYCISTALRDEQIKLAIRKVKGRIQKFEGKRDEPIAVVGYGPSLKHTWEELRGFKYIITTSGAHRFLIDRGIIPTWHLDVDPRAHKIAILGDPHPAVTYLPCSTCHPNYFDRLVESNAKVELWHCFASEAESMRILPPGEYALTGGCDAGLRAMAVARFFGFVDQHVFGMDGCADEEVGHAAVHANPMKKFFDLEYGGKTFRTAPNLMEVAKTVPHEVDMLKLDRYEFHGEGLVQAIMADHKPKTVKKSNIAFIKPVLITDEYKALNRKLHEERADYGTSGSRHAPTVLKLCESLKTTSVLDYGCGKGTLANNIPFPIWEYDPCVPGKDEQPRAADIVVCTDVLEHVEPARLGDVLGNLAALTKKVGYFVIATRPAKKNLPDGRNAHLIQKPVSWWRETLARYFEIGQVFDANPQEVQVVVGPRKADSKDGIQRVEHKGIVAKYHVPNDTVAWRVKTLLTKEPCTIDWIDSFKPGEVLYDIGANMGGYTVLAARNGVKVFAFEPEAQNYALLCRNMTLNDVEGRAYPLAISDRPGLSALYLAVQQAGGSCNSLGEKVGFDLKEREGIEQGAVAFRMDDLDLPKPDHIKIDVDGFEHKVIAGGLDAIKNAKSVLVEVNTNLPEHMEMVQKLKDLGLSFDQLQVDASMRKDGAFKGCAEYVFRRLSKGETDLLAAIEKAEVRQEPFPHLVLTGVDLEITTPDDSAYRSLEEVRGTAGYKERRTAPIQTWLTTGRFRAALERKFNVKASSEDAFLLRDSAGYKINPHTDTPAKAVTALFYLNDAEEGTSLYRPKKNGFKSKEGGHLPRKDFIKVDTVPFKAGTMLAFARTDESFHGVEEFKGEGFRDILCWNAQR